MGLLMSSLGAGPSQMFSFVMGTVYKSFTKEEIKTPDDFHLAMLDVFSTFNTSVPGKHYDAPTKEEVLKLYEEWKDAKEPARKTMFINFMVKNVKMNKTDHATMLTGVLMPPIAMVAKRGGEKVPQISMIRHVPDVLFVPSVTVIALISVRASKRLFVSEIKTEASPANR